MREIIALAAKDLKLLARDKAAFFFTLGFPLVYAMLFGMIFGGDGESEDRAMRVAVVDEDQSEVSKSFVKALDDSVEMKVIPLSREEAQKAVRKARCAAWLRLPKGFGSDESSPFTGSPPVIEIGADPSRPAENGMLEGLLMRHGFESLFSRFSDSKALAKSLAGTKRSLADQKGLDPDQRLAIGALLDSSLDLSRRVEALGKLGGDDEDSGSAGGMQGFAPFTISRSSLSRKRDDQPRSAFDVSFPQSIAWAIMGAAAGFAISLAIERSRGTLLRLRSAPMTPSSILYGKALACLTTNLGVIGILLGIGILAFGVTFDSPLFVIMAVLSSSLCFVGLMALLAVLGKTEQAAGGIGWAVFLIMAMLGGGMMPLFLMPSWMAKIGMVSPVRWTIIALEGSIWRDFSLEEMLLPCGVLLGIGAVSFALAARLFRREMSR